MKRLFVSLLLIALTVAPTIRSQAQIIDAVEQALIAAITAADVVVQQAQSYVIDLQNAQKELENDLSLNSLNDIGNYEQQFKNIYSNYFQELWEVKNAISTFQQITNIIAQQKELVTEYQQGYARVQQDSHFTPAEVTYIYNVYTGIISQSVKSVDEILQVLTSFTFQMSDAARLRIISQASSDIQHQTNDLRNFNSQTAQTSLQRAQSQQDINGVISLYGLSSQ